MIQAINIRIQAPFPSLQVPRASCSSQRTCPCFRVQNETSICCKWSKAFVVTKCCRGWSKMHSMSSDQLTDKSTTKLAALLTSATKEVATSQIIGNDKVGVLLLNLGGPETLEDVQPFLFNLFADPDIIRLPRMFRFLQKPLAQFVSVIRAPKSKEGYASIGGGSPLRQMTDAQAEELRKALCAKNVPADVYVGMRYWHPFTEEAIEQIKRDKISKLVVLPLYPQFSISTSGSSLRLLESLFRDDEYLVNMQHTVIPSWYQREGYIKSMANLIEKELRKFDCPEELLEMLINNIGEPVHMQVVDTGVLPILVKIVKKKSDLPVRERIFLLLDAAQTSVGGASGRFPQFYSAYYELVSAGVQFPQRPNDGTKNQCASTVNNRNPPNSNHAAGQNERSASKVAPEKVPDSSILQKAGASFEVLSDVLDAINTEHPEGAKDEFTLDLVEQCSFQKQRVMHLALTSRDENVVSRAVELNEDLERVLKRHDTLMAWRTTSMLNHDDEDEEEEAEQLSRRIRKGKACVRSEDEYPQNARPLGLLGSSARGEMINRPLIRPLSDETKQDYNGGRPAAAVVSTAIPPPPAKHFERERYFQENKVVDGPTLGGHMRGLSLHSRNGSSSLSGSVDSSD